jgi:hypothetical protein
MRHRNRPTVAGAAAGLESLGLGIQRTGTPGSVTKAVPVPRPHVGQLAFVRSAPSVIDYTFAREEIMVLAKPRASHR